MELKEIQEKLNDFLKRRNWLEFSANDVLLHLYEELGEIGIHGKVGSYTKPGYTG